MSVVADAYGLDMSSQLVLPGRGLIILMVGRMISGGIVVTCEFVFVVSSCEVEGHVSRNTRADLTFQLHRTFPTSSGSKLTPTNPAREGFQYHHGDFLKSMARTWSTKCHQLNMKSFRIGELANSGFSKMQLLISAKSMPLTKNAILHEMCQTALTMLEKSRPKPGHHTLAR